MDIPVLYMDEFLAVCAKPVGVSSESPGLPDLLAGQIGREVFPVHRLDQGTGGTIILALSARAGKAMQRLFLQNQVRKEYLAAISGVPGTGSGTFSDYLYHDKKINKTFIVSRPRKGVRDAYCEWELLRSVRYEEQDLSLVKIILHTGRTHQIRVQFASRGYPLAGDRKYGSRISAGSPSLWAYGVCFPHPFIPERSVSVVSEVPDVFPWNLFSRT